MAAKIDRELEEFRRVMEVPSTFEEGFNWSSLLGALFIGLLMVPGSIYMGLLAGVGVGAAAQWVTVILFIEVAKRAHKHLNRSEIFVLFYMAGAAMGMPFSGLLYNQFFMQSDAVAAAGITEDMPAWFAPSLDNVEAYDNRSFFQVGWLPVIGMVLFGTFFGALSNTVLGYGLFRVASDFEKLPFPMAPIGAQGIMALAEDVDEKDAKKKEDSWRWRVFSIGGALGFAFGAIYLLLPTLSSALTGTRVQVFPIPFTELTDKTSQYLPAVATGITWDLGLLIAGMVMPFYGMVGGFVGLLITCIANPVLYEFGILKNWSFGENTISTTYLNNIDFYFSFQIGIALAIAAVGLYKVYTSVKEAKAKETGAGGRRLTLRELAAPTGRGDIKPWLVITVYFIITMTYITVSAFLLYWHHDCDWTPKGNENGIRNVILILFGLGFIYTPIISYVTARLEGLVGQVVAIPMITEASLILSGYRGVACWFLPIPIANYGAVTVFYRQCELTGTKFTSIWKTQIILYPIILLSSIFFMNFLWGLNPVPSAVYPNAEKMWPLQAANATIMYTSTTGEYSMFEEAFNVWYIGVGAVFGLLLFTVMSWSGAPVLLTYGVVRGLGQTMPHAVVPQFIGALIGRYYFQKRLGLKWRQYIPVVAAGFACGTGLIATFGVGITFLSKAVIHLPY